MASKKQDNKISVVESAKTVSPAAKTAPKKTTAAKTVAKAETPKVAAPKAEKAVKTTAPKAAAKPATTAKAPKAAAAKVTTKKVDFILPKEAVQNAEKVALVGDFNNWDLKSSILLKKQKDGSYKTALELEAGKVYQYRFLIDGTKWENAWDAESYEPTPFGVYNSVVKA